MKKSPRFCTSLEAVACELQDGGALSLLTQATSARAVRPASLAASARPEHIEAVAGSASARAARPLASGARPVRFVAGARSAVAASFQAEGSVHRFIKGQFRSRYSEALRGSAALEMRGRAGTSFARAGGFSLFASGATQRTMHAGCVLLWARPNPSVERTCPGKPGQASHLVR